MRVTELTDDDRLWVKERTELLFGGDFVVSRTEVHDPHKLPGFIATEGRERVGLVTYSIYGGECEIVTIDALCQFMGVGTLLLEKVEEAAREAGCQSSGPSRPTTASTPSVSSRSGVLRQSQVRLGGMTKIRLLKPNVPRSATTASRSGTRSNWKSALRPRASVRVKHPRSRDAHRLPETDPWAAVFPVPIRPLAFMMGLT